MIEKKMAYESNRTDQVNQVAMFVTCLCEFIYSSSSLLSQWKMFRTEAVKIGGTYFVSS
jgi:hypothetical protein